MPPVREYRKIPNSALVPILYARVNTDHCTGADDGGIRPFEGFMGAVVILEDTKREIEAYSDQFGFSV